MLLGLVKDAFRVRKARLLEVGIRDDARHSVSKIREKEHRKGDEVHLTRLKIETWGEGSILGEEEAM